MESSVGEEGGGRKRSGEISGTGRRATRRDAHAVRIGGSGTRAFPAPRAGTWATRSQRGLTPGLEPKIMLTLQRSVTSGAHRRFRS